MRDNPRTTVVSALAGLVLLGGLFAFTVVVPELGDDPTEPAAATGEGSTAPEDDAADNGPIDLPDQLTATLVAVDLGTLPAETGQGFGDVEALTEQEASISEGLEEVFGVPGAFRVYAAADRSAIAQVTVLDRAPGLFTPDALPVDPSLIGVTRAASELVEADGAVCSVSWQAEVPEGQEIDPAVVPQAVRCQYGAGERTYEITSQGLTVEAAVGALKDLAGA